MMNIGLTTISVVWRIVTQSCTQVAAIDVDDRRLDQFDQFDKDGRFEL